MVSGISALSDEKVESGICEQKISRSWRHSAPDKKEGSASRAFPRAL
jgi:hypothetical protein